MTNGEAPQISPDGRLLAFVATDRGGRTVAFYVRSRDACGPAAPRYQRRCVAVLVTRPQRLGILCARPAEDRRDRRRSASDGRARASAARRRLEADDVVILFYGGCRTRPPAAGAGSRWRRRQPCVPKASTVRGFQRFRNSCRMAGTTRLMAVSGLRLEAWELTDRVGSIDSTETKMLVERSAANAHASHPGTCCTGDTQF